MTTARTKLGSLGERHARSILEGHGFRFMDANWRAESGEIDLVMIDGEFVVMVEVKVRRGARAGRAEEAISIAKGRRLLATGEWYIADHPDLAELPWRIDLVAITIDDDGRVMRHRHIRDAVVTG
jgi:putative endonuclease